MMTEKWFAYEYTPEEGDKQYLKMQCINIPEEDDDIIIEKMMELAQEIWK